MIRKMLLIPLCPQLCIDVLSSAIGRALDVDVHEHGARAMLSLHVRSLRGSLSDASSAVLQEFAEWSLEQMIVGTGPKDDIDYRM